MRGLQLGLGALALLLASGQSTLTFRQGAAPTAGYAGVRDVQIVPNGASPNRLPDANYATNADTADGFVTRSATLMRWDLPGVDAGEIVGAEITVFVTGGSPQVYDIYPVLVPWVDTEATWLQADALAPWADAGASAPGLDHGATPIGATVTGASNVFATWPLDALGVTTVQQWAADPSTNFGVIIQRYYPNGYGLGWQSAEATTVTQRPRLTLTLTDGGTLDYQQGVAPSAAYTGMSDVPLSFGPGAGMASYEGRALGSGGSQQVASLLGFDLSTVPVTATLLSATLVLHASVNPTGSLALKQALQPWVAAQATWLTRDGATAWQSAGAAGALDRGAMVLATGTGDGGVWTLPFDAAGLALLQSWVQTPAANGGWVLTDSSTTGASAAYADSEDPTVANRPLLVVRFVDDAGAEDAGIVDAGAEADAGVTEEDGGADAGPGADAGEPLELTVGCGCQSGSSVAWFLCALGVGLLLQRPRRRACAPTLSRPARRSRDAPPRRARPSRSTR